MANFSINPHAKERVMQRIKSSDIQSFVRGVTTAAQKGLISGPSWAVKVVQAGRVLGYAVGRGTYWSTTLSAGQQPHETSIITIKV